MQTEKVFIGDTEIDIDTQIELAEHALKCAISHLNDLLAKRNSLDAHIEAQYQEHVDAEFGRLCIESDKADKAIAEAMKCI